MKQFRDKERQETVSNGYAHDIEHEAETKVGSMVNMASPEVKGLAALGTGLLLLAHTLGYFASLNWALMAIAVAGIVWGATTSNVWNLIKRASDYIGNKVSGK